MRLGYGVRLMPKPYNHPVRTAESVAVLDLLSDEKKIDIYRSAIGRCGAPLGKWVHDQAATFTMTLCAPTREEAWEVGRESFEWYPKAGARLIGSLAEWMAETKTDLGNYAVRCNAGRQVIFFVRLLGCGGFRRGCGRAGAQFLERELIELAGRVDRDGTLQ
jgi:alkanesulfonate monooxygenase SsuD/methylene tetrahydromethanopterin reductase-like flavin-dependent oxidoreductase (luciferase family)